MSAKVIIKEGYGGEPIGEKTLQPSEKIKDFLALLPKETFLAIRDNHKLSHFDDIGIYSDSMHVSIDLDQLNWFECHCISEKIIEDKESLRDIFGTDVLINERDKNSNDKIEIEVDITIPYFILVIPVDLESTFGDLFEKVNKFHQFVSDNIKEAKSLSRDIQSYPKPERNIKKPKRIFLSHSSRDKAFARKLAKQLKSHDFHTWIDEEDILVGQDFIDQIEKGIKESDYVVIVMSKNYVDFGPWAKEEYKLVLTEQISKNLTKILPVLIEDCNLPDFLKSKHYADFRNEFAFGFKKLINSLNKLSK